MARESVEAGDPFVTVGTERVPYRPETKRAIDGELLLLHVPIFALIGAYSVEMVPWPVFMALFYMVAMRIFIGNHDRYHADPRERLPRWLEVVSEGLQVVVTPWDETYDSIRDKHLRHHRSHATDHPVARETAGDPHSVFEAGGFFRALLSCLFYEEIQLAFDIRNRNLARSRLHRLLVYLPLIAAYVAAFGWRKFAVVFLAMRIVGVTAWFVFSWGIHHPLVYRFGFSGQVPRIFQWTFAFVHGRRVAEGCLHHATHHAWPGIPYDQLHRVDAAAAGNPEAAAEIASGR